MASIVISTRGKVLLGVLWLLQAVALVLNFMDAHTIIEAHGSNHTFDDSFSSLFFDRYDDGHARQAGL
jgi:hypothetical protein